MAHNRPVNSDSKQNESKNQFIHIKHLEKHKVFAALYNVKSHPVFALSLADAKKVIETYNAPINEGGLIFDDFSAEAFLTNRNPFDFHRHYMGYVNLNGDVTDTARFDAFYGKGCAEALIIPLKKERINELREELKEQNKMELKKSVHLQYPSKFAVSSEPEPKDASPSKKIKQLTKALQELESDVQYYEQIKDATPLSLEKYQAEKEQFQLNKKRFAELREIVHLFTYTPFEWIILGGSQRKLSPPPSNANELMDEWLRLGVTVQNQERLLAQNASLELSLEDQQSVLKCK